MTENNKKFTKTHEWAELHEEHVTVGITDHAQALLGDLVFVELPAIGTAVQAGDTLGVVESVKAAADFYAPISGTVIDINTSVQDDMTQINRSPENHGWLVKLSLQNRDEFDQLLDHEIIVAP